MFELFGLQDLPAAMSSSNIQAAVYAAIPTGAGVLAARVLAKKPGLREAALALGAAGGLVAAHVSLAGMPKLPPIDSAGWIPITTLAVGVLAAVLAVARVPKILSAVLLAALVGAGLFLVAKPAWQAQGNVAKICVVALALLAALLPLTGDIAAKKSMWLSPWAAWAPLGGLAALAFVGGESALLGSLMGATTTVAVVLAAGTLVLGPREFAVGAQTGLTSYWAGLATYALLFAKMTPLGVGLMAAAMLAPLVGVILPGKAWMKVGLALGLATVLALFSSFAVRKANTSTDHSDPAGMYR